MSLTFTLETTATRRDLRALNKRCAFGAQQLGRRIAEDVMRRAQEDVPYLTGKLKASAYIDPPSTRANVSTVGFGYRAYYASARHEATWLYNAKWLEKAINETVYPPDAIAEFKRTMGFT